MPRIPALTLLLAMLSMAGGCASSGSVTPGQVFSLDTGASARLPDDSLLRYVGIANDSRCPPKVTCIRAGDADVLLDHVVEGNPTARRVVLNSERATTAELGPWRLQLRELAAGERPRATLQIEGH